MGDALPRRCMKAVPFLFTAENKTELFLSLKREMEQGRIKFPFDPQLIQSLKTIRRYYRLGRVIIDAERTVETGHADEATALALACYEMPVSTISVLAFDL